MKKELLIFLLVVLLKNTCFSQGFNEVNFLPHPDSLMKSDFKELLPYINNKKLILIGEANHGSHEVFKVKETFIKYLVEDCGLKDIVIEANFATCLIINEFITWQSGGDAHDFAKLFYVWPYRTEEFEDIITWMREYNQDKGQEDMVRLWGMDMQQAYPALKLLQKELVPPKEKEVLSIPEFEVRMDEIKYVVDDSTLSLLSQLVDSASTEKRPILQRCVEIIKMQKEIFAIYQSGDKSGRKQFRDSCMAENVKWIYAGLKENSKILVWAHNSHIQKASQSRMRKEISMGHFLLNWFGESAYFIGFDFNKGTFIFPHPSAELVSVFEEESHDFARILDEKNYDLCFIPFTDANQQTLNDEVGMRYNSYLMEHKYTDLYDAIFFVNEVTPTNVLK